MDALAGDSSGIAPHMGTIMDRLRSYVYIYNMHPHMQTVITQDPCEEYLTH